MLIGLPREIKESENRVGLTPGAVKALVTRGHRVLVQMGAGDGSALSDDGVCPCRRRDWSPQRTMPGPRSWS